jgi:hypothetical protein
MMQGVMAFAGVGVSVFRRATIAPGGIMKLHGMVLSILAASFFCAAAPPEAPSPRPEPVPFRPVAGNYFIINTYPVVHTPTFFIIKSYNAFDSLFHWAGVMRQDTSQLIAREKMDSCFIVAVVIRGAFSVALNIQKVALASGALSIYYTSADSEPHPEYTSNSRAIALVSNCAYDSIRFFENDRPVRNPWIDRR